MKKVSFDDARRNFSKVFRDVSEAGAIIAIERSDKPSLVVMPLSEYTSMTETLYLLGTRADAEALLAAKDNVKAGRFIRRDPAHSPRRAAKRRRTI